jgi:hypothetical protein
MAATTERRLTLALASAAAGEDVRELRALAVPHHDLTGTLRGGSG